MIEVTNKVISKKERWWELLNFVINNGEEQKTTVKYIINAINSNILFILHTIFRNLMLSESYTNYNILIW